MNGFRARRKGSLTIGGAFLGLACLSPVPAHGQAQTSPPRIHIANAGREPIISVHGSPVTDTNWGSNMLGRIQIPPGSTVSVVFRERDNCVFNLRIIWADGRAEDRMRENVCGTIRTFRMDGSTAQPAGQR